MSLWACWCKQLALLQRGLMLCFQVSLPGRFSRKRCRLGRCTLLFELRQQGSSVICQQLAFHGCQWPASDTTMQGCTESGSASIAFAIAGRAQDQEIFALLHNMNLCVNRMPAIGLGAENSVFGLNRNNGKKLRPGRSFEGTISHGQRMIVAEKRWCSSSK